MIDNKAESLMEDFFKILLWIVTFVILSLGVYFILNRTGLT